MNINIDRNAINMMSAIVTLPLVLKIREKNTLKDVKKLYNTLVVMWNNDLIDEAFHILYIFLKTLNIRFPKNFKSIINNTEFKAYFVEEVILDFEDIFYELK